MNKLKDIKKIKKILKKTLFSSQEQLQNLRENYDNLFYSPHLPNNVDLKEKEFKTIKTDILKPEISAFGRTILYAHGGAFIMGSRKSYRNFCASIANTSSANLYLPEYRLAPEYPFPTALEDLYSVYASIIEQEKILPDNLILAGDGSGATLILALINYLKRKELPMPNLLILISPWVDLTCTNENFQKKNIKDFIFSSRYFLEIAKLYTYENNLKNELVSPIFGDFKNFPKTLIQYGANEILSLDANELAQKLEKSNCEYKLDEYKDMNHLFQALPDYFPQAHIAVENLGKQINLFLNKEDE